MCGNCGCVDKNLQVINSFSNNIVNDINDINHKGIVSTQRIEVERNITQKNDLIAAKNRLWLDQNQIKAINIISSPGSGKTTLIARTLEELSKKINIAVIVGDQETQLDALRLKQHNQKVKQINTISSCHLDANMISQQLGDFVDPSIDLLIIENVGNLVCPTAFDLGEHYKIALLSTTEGENKPVKYPVLFHQAGLCIITKTDLIPHLNWNLNLCRSYIHQVQPQANIIEVSAYRDDSKGMELWFDYLLNIIG